MLATDEIIHYGVKGMRWGVRRYEKYDGSYTKKGVERYKKADKAYVDSQTKAKETKAAYKKGNATKQQLKEAKGAKKIAKRSLNASYKKLRTDKLADQGKQLYKQGKTIGENNMNSANIQAAIVAGSGITNVLLGQMGNQRLANIASVTIAIGGTTVNSIISAKKRYENKRLRAYYAH